MRKYTIRTLFALAILASSGAILAETAPSLSTATFSMYCYWTGEATLGRVPGVVESKIGHLAGKEIVEVTYDPARTDVRELTRALKKERSFYSLIVDDETKKTAAVDWVDPGEVRTERGTPHFIRAKHSLHVAHPDLYFLDLSERQAIALNSWSYFGGPMPEVLSEEQKDRWRRLRSKLESARRPILNIPGLDPAGARSGAALERYREALEAWLSDGSVRQGRQSGAVG